MSEAAQGHQSPSGEVIRVFVGRHSYIRFYTKGVEQFSRMGAVGSGLKDCPQDELDRLRKLFSRCGFGRHQVAKNLRPLKRRYAAKRNPHEFRYFDKAIHVRRHFRVRW